MECAVQVYYVVVQFGVSVSRIAFASCNVVSMPEGKEFQVKSQKTPKETRVDFSEAAVRILREATEGK